MGGLVFSVQMAGISAGLKVLSLGMRTSRCICTCALSTKGPNSVMSKNKGSRIFIREFKLPNIYLKIQGYVKFLTHIVLNVLRQLQHIAAISTAVIDQNEGLFFMHADIAPAEAFPTCLFDQPSGWNFGFIFILGEAFQTGIRQLQGCGL